MTTQEVVERRRSSELAQHVGERVRVAGWVQTVRRLRGISFVVVRDGWGHVQVVAEGDDLIAEVTALGLESVVEIEGTVVADPSGRRPVEVRASAIHVVAMVTAPPPVHVGGKQLDAPLATLLEHAVVANRHPTRRAVFRLGAAAMRGFRSALDTRGFTEIQSPKLVGGATEGGANVFEVKYFDRPAYLAQSPQLYKQIMVGVFERVYEVAPVFRAEPHDTSRHLSQYTSLDVELGFIRGHADVMAVLTEVVRGMVEALGACANELALLEAALPEVPARIPELHFTEAQELIAAALGEHERGPDLSPEGERFLGRWAREQHASDFVFVVGYPMAKRPFYTHPDPARPGSSKSFDLLFRGTELVTGGQRLHRYEDYLSALAARGMRPEPLAAYLDAFRNGMPPHGGFAIGLERFLMQLLGLPNIRLAVLFPRDLTRLVP